MNSQLIRVLQLIVLLGGVAFAAYNVGHEVASHINPFTTTCVYGGIVFVIALLWAISVTVPKSRYWHNWLLGAGALFGWINWAIFNWTFYNQTTCPLNCVASSPWTAPCLYGASLFTLALIAGLRLNLAKR